MVERKNRFLFVVLYPLRKHQGEVVFVRETITCGEGLKFPIFGGLSDIGFAHLLHTKCLFFLSLAIGLGVMCTSSKWWQVSSLE